MYDHLHLENAGFRPPHQSSRPKGALHPPSGIEAIAAPPWLAPKAQVPRFASWKRQENSTDTLEATAPKAQQYMENSKFPTPPKKTEALLAHQLELTFPIDAQKFVAPANAAQTFFGKHQISPPFVALFPHAKWAPTSCTWGSNPYKRPITNGYITGVLPTYRGCSPIYIW